MSRRTERVEPGGEPYLKFARARLAGLEAARKGLDLPSLKKSWVIGGSTIFIESSDFGDLIWISGGASRGFLATMSLTKLPSTNKTFVAEFQPAMNKFGRNKWKKFDTPGAATFRLPQDFGTSTYMAYGSSDQYFKSGVAKDFATGSITAAMVFPHQYTSGGVGQTELLMLAGSTVYKNVGGSRVALAASGSLPSATTAESVSSDGRTLLVVSSGAYFRGDVDLANAVPVTWTSVVDPTPYGTSTSASSSTTIYGIGYGGPARTGSVETLNTSSVSATYPLSRAVGEDGSYKVISAVLATDNSTYTLYTVSPVGGSFLIRDGTNTVVTLNSSVVSFVLPDGNAASFTVNSDDLTSVGTNYTDQGAGTGSGAGTYSRTRRVGTLSTIYADPVNSVLVYEFTYTDTVYTTTSVSAVMFFTTANLSLVSTTHREVGILHSGSRTVLQHEVATPVTSTSSGTIAGTSTVPTSPDGSGGTSSSSSSTTDVLDYSNLPSGFLIPAFPRSCAAGSVTWGGEVYSGIAKATDSWIFTVGRDVDVNNAPATNFMMYAASDTSGAVMTPAYIQYVADSMSLVAGAPDPDAALLVSNPELFTIRANNLTYV